MGNRYYFAEYTFPQETLDTGETGTDLPDEMSINEQIINYIDSEESVVEEGDAEWRFGRHRVNEDANLVIGRFGREFDDEPKQYNEEIGDFEPKQGRDADVSHFIVFLDIKIVSFNQKHRIGKNQFVRAFSTGFSDYYDTAPNMEMSLLENDIDLEDVFETADRVTDLDFDLEPTNPEPTEEMEAMDDRFKETDAETFGLNIFSDGGINTASSVVKAAKGFVENDYGNAVVDYILDNRKEQLNTKSKDAVYEADEEPEELDDVENLSDSLKSQSEGVMDREAQDDD